MFGGSQNDPAPEFSDSKALALLRQEVLAELRQLRKDLKVGEKRMLSVEETAGRLGLSPKTIRNQLSAGTFPIRSCKISGRVLFKAADIDRFLDSL